MTNEPRVTDTPRMPSTARQARRDAVQLLYQLEVLDEPEINSLSAFPDEEGAAELASTQAVELAEGTWSEHEAADRRLTAQAPDWPTHRQPPVDRAILRLGHYELARGRTPPQVVINEAVELAKWYCGEHSPSFINAVLDRIAHAGGALPEPGAGTAPATDQRWLDDAVGETS